MTNLLSKQTLDTLSEAVKKPAYAYQTAEVGIVHIGIGAFHRAHQAVFTDDLLALDPHWKITAVSLRSPAIRDSMAPQDNLYTVVERGAQEDKFRIVGAIDQVLVAPEEPQRVIDEIANSKTKVVTLTVTEKGYCRDKSGKNLDFTNPVIVHDIADLSTPKSLPGFIVAACKLRMRTNEKLTIISCDNLSANGQVTERVIQQFAQHVAPDVAAWITKNVSFCNSMVDRIVPATTEKDIDSVSQILGVVDKSTVVTEPFKQWVIEDNFANDKPAWDKVGALFVADVHAYEHMKLRLLNGIHSTLAYIGFLKGYEYIHQAVADEDCLLFVKALQAQLVSTLDDVPGIDLSAYADTILARFANERVPYKTSQVACDGSQKLAQRLVKPCEIIRKSGAISEYITFVLAAWCRFLEGTDSAGSAFSITDPLGDALNNLAVRHCNNELKQVESILRESGICTTQQLADSDFLTAIATHLKEIHQVGVTQALSAFLKR
ncbi:MULTISPECIES: mannitol dehydrogenase family protein [Pseudoalteromonas]|uniref:Mannitol dehydrogenase family protein n=1 Tax=Pseudoalteromonas haloplanktis TaxID=228 RepID=A0ABU1BGZ7_PSEHA|nr:MULTISPECIES: mannitol dehydrogenase family protein [Pseudoalteromonas]MCF6146133.1 fructuronate reductase [Pseudoalteromonas mariniglutinosa NCIMB 1770]MDQ9093754.1 mannitol dehydrogenase family protein [Pseudoalteromonas haloplanktis]TMN74177.1 mannitol dehydrogenase family protein [Pseudoalteromonas sp. S1727]